MVFWTTATGLRRGNRRAWTMQSCTFPRAQCMVSFFFFAMIFKITKGKRVQSNLRIQVWEDTVRRCEQHQRAGVVHWSERRGALYWITRYILWAKIIINCIVSNLWLALKSPSWFQMQAVRSRSRAVPPSGPSRRAWSPMCCSSSIWGILQFFFFYPYSAVPLLFPRSLIIYVISPGAKRLASSTRDCLSSCSRTRSTTSAFW